MADAIRNLIWHTVTSVASSGLGALTLGPAVTEHLAFASGDNGLSFSCVISEAGVGKEVRRAMVYTHSGATLTRGTLESSTSGGALAFTTPEVWVVIAASNMDATTPDLLPTIAAADVASSDLFLVWDASASALKSITLTEMHTIFG